MIDQLNEIDEACKMFNDGWQATDWLPMEGGVAPVILWEGRPEPARQPDAPFARFTMMPNLSNQDAFTPGAEKQYLNAGIISVQCFAPLQWPDAYEAAHYMGIMAMRVYQGKPSPNGMWFRNCRTNRIGPSGGWYQFNTLIEYQYNELR